MKSIISVLLIGLLFASCSHRIVRVGYDVNKSNYKDCDVIIKKGVGIIDTLATKVGEIKLGESGLSMSCSEEHAIKILKNEACALDADIILITEENRPDLWSSCYRCRAEFYRTTTSLPSEVKPIADRYEPTKVKQRVAEDRNKNTAIAIGAVALGFLLGFLIF